MFHNSTTLHHSHSQSFAISGESRLAHLDWLGEKKLKLAGFWRRTGIVRKVVAWPFKGPARLVRGAVDLTLKGAEAVWDAGEGSFYTGVEGAKQIAKGVALPPANLAYSRAVSIKRTLWDTGLAAFTAPFKMAYALAMSPIETLRGTRKAVEGILSNGRGLLNSLSHFELRNAAKHTRDAIKSLFLPVTMPMKPILAPLGEVASTAFDARIGHTAKTFWNDVTNTVPAAWQGLKNAPQVGFAKAAERKAGRGAIKAALAQQEKEKKAAWDAEVAKYIGEPVPQAAAKGSGGKKMAA